MHADDLVVLCPSSAGLQQLPDVHSVCGNITLSTMQLIHDQSNKRGESLKFPDCEQSDNALDVCNKVQYLGSIMTDPVTNDDEN